MFHVVARRDPWARPGLEMFDEDAWDAAFARFEELSAPSVGPAHARDREQRDPPRPPSVGLLAGGRLDDVLAMYDPGITVESRRRIGVTTEATPLADWHAMFLTAVEQWSSWSLEPVAVRGDRIALGRLAAGDDAGNESITLNAVEVDAAGRFVRLTYFDNEDEIAAIDLLDEWYIEGEGAADAVVLSAQREGMRRYHAHDWDGLRAMSASTFEFVDHRPLPWPMSDAEGLIRLMQERIAQVPDLQSRIRKLFVQGRAVLSVGDVVGTDEHGGLQQWPVLTVYETDVAGANRRIEYFAPEQWDAALARFDEIVAEPADPRHPRAENAVTRMLSALSVARRPTRTTTGRGRRPRLRARGPPFRCLAPAAPRRRPVRGTWRRRTIVRPHRIRADRGARRPPHAGGHTLDVGIGIRAHVAHGLRDRR